MPKSYYKPVRIGLLSDTHGYLDPALFDHFAQFRPGPAIVTVLRFSIEAGKISHVQAIELGPRGRHQPK